MAQGHFAPGFLLVFLLSLTSIGCSHLRVTTEIYRDLGISLAQRSEAIRATANLEYLLTRLPDTLPAAASRFYVDNVDKLNDDHQTLLGNDLSAYGESYADVLREVVLEPLDKQRLQLHAHANQIRESIPQGEGPQENRAWLEGELANLRDELNRFKGQMNAKLEQVFEANVKALANDIAAFALAADSSTQVTSASVQSEMSPFTSPLKDTLDAVSIDPLEREELEIGTVERLPLTDARVAEIVGAPNEDWAKYVNDVKVTGYFGNSEFSIVMRNLGNYHLKGVVFDPSQVSQATLDTMAQAVNMVAAAYGVPVRVGDSDSSTAQQPSSIPMILGELAGIEHAEETRRARMAELFSKLLAQETAISAAANSDTEAGNRKDTIAKLIKDAANQLRSGK